MSPGGNDQGKTQSLYDGILKGRKKTKSLFSDARIHRVPEELRKQNESAYTPHLIAIGPLHRDIEQLQNPMRDVKKSYTYCLLDRVAKGMQEEGRKKLEDNTKKMKGKESGELDKKRRELLEECEKQIKESLYEVKDKMKKNVNKARKYYAEEVEVNDDEMAEMMLVDGCFILELLYCDKKKPREAAKITTKGEDSGNSEASSSSVPLQINEGEGGSGSGYKRSNIVEQPINEGEGGSRKQGKADPIFDSILTAEIVKHDLLLLENQIPFFVLDDLFTLTVDKIPGQKKLSLTDYVLSYFDDILSPEGENSGSKKKNGCCSSPSACGGTEKENEHEKEVSGKANETKTGCCNSPGDCVLWVRGGSTKEEKPYHILHLLHQYYLPGRNKEPSGEKTTLQVRASDLDYAGINFVPAEDKNLFALKFNEPTFVSWWCCSAKFEIPTLPIHDATEPFLRNLIALEQCCSRVSRHFTSYAKLMDILINSKEDVRVLQKAKVIDNYLGSEEDVTELFNNLCKEVVLGQFYFNDECVKAFNYGKHWWPQSRAYVRRRFVSSPWAFISVILGLATFGIQITTFVRSFLK